MMRRNIRQFGAGLLCAGLWTGLATGGASAQSADPPAQVGRLSEVDGTVSFHTADQAQWSQAVINYPVPAGSSFWTEPSARAALQLGPAIIRLASQTEFDVVALDDHNFQGQIGQGAVNLHLFALNAGDGFQIVTARGTVQITAPGHYHIDGGSGATPTLVTVFDGAAEFVGTNTNLTVHPSETAAISGDPASALTYDVAGAQPDPLDQWATSREAQLRIAAQPQYVSAEMTGYQDLDGYGSWSQTPSDGPVWYPANMPQDWAPYRDGHWAYVAPWGWTWIDDAAWGFAPFHYGRWARVEDRWAWYPGAVVQQPVYAPALVAFVGGSPGPSGLAIGISIGALTGAAAWIPLGPHEAYDPPYRHSAAYLHNVNDAAHAAPVAGNRTVKSYANASAVTVVRAAAMVGSQPIAHAAVAVPAGQLAARPNAAAPPAVRPTLATAGATPTAVRAAGGPAGPAGGAAGHGRPAAPGPLAAPGHPATAVALTRVAPPSPGTHAAPPHVVAASATAPANAPASAVGSRPGTSSAPAARAAEAPPPAGEAPGKPAAAPPHGVPVAAAPRPAEVAPHPAERPAPAAASAPHPAEIEPHPAERPAPAAASAPHPAEIEPHPAERAAPAAATAPHPAEIEPHPAERPAPAAAPHPAEVAPPHPTPAALPPPAVHEAPAPHSAPPPPPHAAPEAAAHPAPPPPHAEPPPAQHAAPPAPHPEPEKKEEHKE